MRSIQLGYGQMGVTDFIYYHSVLLGFQYEVQARRWEGGGIALLGRSGKQGGRLRRGD